MPETESVTVLLRAHREGDPDALGKLLPIVYAELRLQARSQHRRWSGVETLNTTALVHEAYLKLANHTLDVTERAHFLAIAGRAMRQVIIDYVKKQGADKRGGNVQHVEIDDRVVSPQVGPSVTAFELAQVLDLLETASPEAARIVECRFFAGMSVEDTALALGVSVPTVVRRWRTARAFLFHHLRSDGSLAL